MAQNVGQSVQFQTEIAFASLRHTHTKKKTIDNRIRIFCLPKQNNLHFVALLSFGFEHNKC